VLFSVIATDANGCVAEDQFQVNAIVCCPGFVVDGVAIPPTCAGFYNGWVGIDVPTQVALAYSWNTVPPQTTDSAIALGAGEYSVLITDPQGCDTTLTFTLSDPPVLTVSITGETPLCQGILATATAQGNGGSGVLQYAWSTQAVGSQIDYSFSITTTLVVSAIDTNGCLAQDQLLVEIEPPPIASFTTSADTACAGQLVTFVSTSIDADSLLWLFGRNGVSNTAENTISFSDPGTETVSLTTFNESGCSSLPNELGLVVAPMVEISLVADQEDCSRSLAAELQVLGADECALWLNDEPVFASCVGAFSISVPDVGTYNLRVIASNRAGCAHTATVLIKVDDAVGLYVPNVFTPNGDGTNEVFGLPWLALEPSFSLRIFNRWGQEVFASNDALDQWDGTVDGGAAPDGVYAYVIAAPDPCSSGDVELRGHLTLLR